MRLLDRRLRNAERGEHQAVIEETYLPNAELVNAWIVAWNSAGVDAVPSLPFRLFVLDVRQNRCMVRADWPAVWDAYFDEERRQRHGAWSRAIDWDDDKACADMERISDALMGAYTWLADAAHQSVTRRSDG